MAYPKALVSSQAKAAAVMGIRDVSEKALREALRDILDNALPSTIKVCAGYMVSNDRLLRAGRISAQEHERRKLLAKDTLMHANGIMHKADTRGIRPEIAAIMLALDRQVSQNGLGFEYYAGRVAEMNRAM